MHCNYYQVVQCGPLLRWNLDVKVIASSFLRTFPQSLQLHLSQFQCLIHFLKIDGVFDRFVSCGKYCQINYGSICHTIKNNQLPFLFSKNELDMGTVIDVTVGLADHVSQD